MDIYLVYSQGKHQFITNPSPVELEESIILSQKLNISLGCQDRAKFLMLQNAALDMYSRTSEKMIPEQLEAFIKMTESFLEYVPEIFQISWKIQRELCTYALTERFARAPSLL